MATLITDQGLEHMNAFPVEKKVKVMEEIMYQVRAIAGRNLTHYHEIGLVAPLFHHADQFVDPENRKMCVEPGENYLSNEFIEFETVIAALPPHAESCLLEAHEKWDPPFGESAY